MPGNEQHGTGRPGDLVNPVEDGIRRGGREHITHHVGIQQPLPHKAHGDGFMARPIPNQHRHLVTVGAQFLAPHHARVRPQRDLCRIGSNVTRDHVVGHGFACVIDLGHPLVDHAAAPPAKSFNSSATDVAPAST